jgi:hypothetical protein
MLQQLRTFACRILERVENFCARLMYDREHRVFLGFVEDNLRNVEDCFSFVCHNGNGLANEYLKLSVRACTNTRYLRLAKDA